MSQKLRGWLRYLLPTIGFLVAFVVGPRFFIPSLVTGGMEPGRARMLCLTVGLACATAGAFLERGEE